MKVKSFLLGLLAMTAVVACQEDQLQETPKLDLGSESVTVPAEGQDDVTFTVTSNVAWTATSDKEWATVDPASGDGSDSAVTVTVEVGANDEDAARTAVITIAAGNLTKTFTINQPAMEAVVGDAWYVAGGFNGWSTTASPMTLENGWYVLTDVAVDEEGFKFLKNSSWEINLTADATVIANVKYAALDGQGKGNTFVEPLGTYDLYLSATLDSLCVMTSGLKPGEEPSIDSDVSLDGKQWVFTWDVYKTQAVFDFGVTEEGVFHFAYDAGGVYYPWLSGEYIIEVKDETTGVAHLNLSYNGEPIQANLPYSELTAKSVKFEPAELASLLGEAPVVMTLSNELLPIVVEDFGGEGGLDGYQWVGYSEEAESMILLDFSYTEDITLLVGASEDGEVFELLSAADYAIEPIDETSGVIYVQYFDPESYDPLDEEEWSYSGLGDGFVTVSIPELGEIEMELTEGCEFSFGGGGDGPQGIIPNGEYWLVEGTKFAEPVAAGKTYGYLPSSEGVENGGSLASLASNAFTFTYIADYGCYTIQDSYGRYLGQGFNAESGEVYKSFNLASSLPGDETVGLYFWIIDTPLYGSYNEGEWDIYNMSTDYSITYDPAYSTWGIYDPSNTAEFPGYPVLIPADNPVESLPEPEPAGPVEATIAEFIAAEDSTDVVYRVSGTIVSIAEISANYKNATFDIADEAGNKVTIYRMKMSTDATTAIENLGLTVGDYVTVEGNRVTFYGSPQMSNGIYVSHEDREAPVSDADVVVDLTAQGYTNAAEVTTLTVDGVTLTFDKGTGSNTPKWYDSGSAVRVYAKGTLTVAASQAIEKIVFVYGSSDKSNEITASTGEFSVDTWKGSAESVVFTVGGTKDHRRFAKVEVYYK